MRALMAVLAAALVVAACGGGGSGENIAGVNLGGGGGGGGGGGAGGGGAAQPVGGPGVAPGPGAGAPAAPVIGPPPEDAIVAPIVSAPSPTFGPIVTNCVHAPLPGTTEYNVGGPADGANRVEHLRLVNWGGLNAGDTVRIHWRDTPYNEKFALWRSGTADRPIRVCGVSGPAGQRPAITGIGAFSPPNLPSTPEALEAYGVLVIAGPNYDHKVQHVIVENLRIGDTKTGPGRDPIDDVDLDSAFFHPSAGGAQVQYSSAAACIRMRQAHHITLRNNELTNCGDGLFAQSLSDSDIHITRNLLVEGNYIHDNAIIGDESRHQAYLQGVDITVQFNYFGLPRTRPEGVASGNQLKMRVAGAVVRYNYFENGARTLDLVEAEEHINMIAPWLYAQHRAEYLACQVDGCLGLGQAELDEYDARQEQDWLKYQNAYVYGNLIRVRGNGQGTLLPANLVHYGFDNSQHDRQPGTLWFFHNTVLWQTNRSNLSVARLFDYGSDFGEGGYYGKQPSLQNAGNQLRFIWDWTRKRHPHAFGTLCTALDEAPNCVDWGPMLQHRPESYGRMRAFSNALVRTPFTAGGIPSDFEFTRNRWDKLDITGAMWITTGWNVDSNGDSNGGGFGRRLIPQAYPGGNDAHHVTGVQHLLTGVQSPIDPATMAPVPASELHNQASPWPQELLDGFKPAFSVTVDPAVPGRLTFTPRAQWGTLGAAE